MLPHLLLALTLTAGQVEPVPTEPPAAFGAPVAVAADFVPDTAEPQSAPGALARAQMGTPKEVLPVPPTSTKEVLPVPPTVSPAPAEKGAEKAEAAKAPEEGGFCKKVLKAYKDEFTKKEATEEETPAPRRGLPEPWSAPPFPGHEYQGYPNIGVAPDSEIYPLQKGLADTALGDFLKDNRIRMLGWATVSGNWSTSQKSNLPAAYWVQPNTVALDQAVIRFEREPDTVQTDHTDWGFRFTQFYGIDYRYTSAGGYFSSQLLKNNREYGYDPLEIYFDYYIPWVAQGMLIRVGRYISPPDIEAQMSPDNYLASHSLLFAYDCYTQTGVLVTVKVNDQINAQAGINAGCDMAPWYDGAVPTAFLGLRWVSKANNDSIYTCLNSCNNGAFRENDQHDNLNYIVSTWTHRFSEQIHTSTEAYYLWQHNALVGGTVSTGPPQSFGGGGGPGAFIGGDAPCYGVLNFLNVQVSKQDYFTIRNEWWDDNKGERTGYATNYSSHTIGFCHNFNAYLQIRPEIGYYRSYNLPAFDLGTKRNMIMGGTDLTIRF
jgi:Putative beta-barrel porin-2, OmpL-like. bbp2